MGENKMKNNKNKKYLNNMGNLFVICALGLYISLACNFDETSVNSMIFLIKISWIVWVILLLMVGVKLWRFLND